MGIESQNSKEELSQSEVIREEVPSAEVFKLSMIADLESGNSQGSFDTMKEIYRGAQGENAEQFTDEHTEAWKSPEVQQAAIDARDRFRTEDGGTNSDEVADRIHSEFNLE
jgi:hypothetical protein